MLMSVQLCYRNGETKTFNVETARVYPRVEDKLKEAWRNYSKNNRPIVVMTPKDMEQLERAKDEFDGLWNGAPIKVLQH